MQMYSFAFRKCYSNPKDLQTKEFEEYIKHKFNLNDIEFRSVKNEVESKIKKHNADIKSKETRIALIQKKINELKKYKNPSKNVKRAIFKKQRKIKLIENSIERNITFGSKKTLRDLTKLYNKINEEGNKEKIKEQTVLWHDQRILPVYIMGEANRKGNRFFVFDFVNKSIIYKPYKGKKITFSFYANNKLQKRLEKLQPLIDNKTLSITVYLSKDSISITYDNEIVSGYYIDRKELKKDVNKINDLNLCDDEKKELINDVYKRYHKELKERQLENKVPNRYLSFDLNPYNIGWCIADKKGKGEFKVIAKGYYDLSEFDEKLNLASTDAKSIKHNNKLKNELINTIKNIFELAGHYKVGYCITENLNTIGKQEASSSCKECNRKNKNVWHRELMFWQIQKRCTDGGIIYDDVLPQYSSFIGNLIYSYADSTNSAIEICRRGMYKYESGLFYPKIAGTILDTMSSLFYSQQIKLKARDAQVLKDGKSWGALHKIAQDNGLRWRWDLGSVETSYQVLRIGSVRSKVKLILFG